MQSILNREKIPVNKSSHYILNEFTYTKKKNYHIVHLLISKNISNNKKKKFDIEIMYKRKNSKKKKKNGSLKIEIKILCYRILLLLLLLYLENIKERTVKKIFCRHVSREKKIVCCNSEAKGSLTLSPIVLSMIPDRLWRTRWTSNPRHSGMNAWLARAFFK